MCKLYKTGKIWDTKTILRNDVNFNKKQEVIAHPSIIKQNDCPTKNLNKVREKTVEHVR